MMGINIYIGILALYLNVRLIDSVLEDRNGLPLQLSFNCKKQICKTLNMEKLYECACTTGGLNHHTSGFRSCNEDDFRAILIGKVIKPWLVKRCKTARPQILSTATQNRNNGESQSASSESSDHPSEEKFSVSRKIVKEYKEYPRAKPNIPSYHDMYRNDYERRMQKRIDTAVDQGTAIGRFVRGTLRTIGSNMKRFIRRNKRSIGEFDGSKLGGRSVFYYDIINAPDRFPKEAATVAASLSDWSAKIPVCFRERVSSHDPPSSFSIAFMPGRLIGSSEIFSRTKTVNSRRQIQLNTDYAFMIGQFSSLSRLDLSLDAVVLHEAGHLLGIPHSSNRLGSSAMFHNYNPQDASNFLDNYEKSRAQQLYGTCSGETHGATKIVYDVNGQAYTTTFIARDTTVWEYSHKENKTIGNPAQTEWLFAGLTGPIDAMIQLGNSRGTRNPLFYVFKGNVAQKYQFRFDSRQRMAPAGTTNIEVLSRHRLTTVDAALWSDDTNSAYLFSGNTVCSYDTTWTLRFCSNISSFFPGLGSGAIDAAYQLPPKANNPNAPIECAFFRGREVYFGEFRAGSWQITFSGTVPNQKGYKWNDLCDNIC